MIYRLKELNDIKGAKIEELRRQIDEQVEKEQMELWVSIIINLPFITNRRLIKDEIKYGPIDRGLSSGTKEKEFLMELYGIKWTSF